MKTIESFGVNPYSFLPLHNTEKIKQKKVSHSNKYEIYIGYKKRTNFNENVAIISGQKEKWEH
jgi:hypothetical protein